MTPALRVTAVLHATGIALLVAVPAWWPWIAAALAANHLVLTAGVFLVRGRLLGLALPSLEDLYRTNPSGAHYISHFPVQNLLYLSGTTPRKDGRAYLPGVVGKDLTIEQGQEAARYATLTTLAAVKYALGDLDRVQQIVHLLGFVNSAPGFGDQPRVINGAADLLVELFGDHES